MGKLSDFMKAPPKVMPPAETKIEKSEQAEKSKQTEKASPNVSPKFSSPPEMPFADHVPASAPERNLPENISAPMKEFVDALDSIYSTDLDAELIGQACVNIVMTLQQHPEYDQMVQDSDIRQLLIGARNAFNIAAVNKAQAKAKRTSKKSSLNDDAYNEIFQKINFGE